MTPNLTNFQRSNIVCSKLRDPKATIEEIADENEVPRSTAGRVLKQAKENNTPAHQPKGGSTEKHSERDKRAVVRTVVSRHRHTPLQAIVNQENMDMGVTTLRKILKEEGYKCYRCIRAKRLSKNNIKERKRAAEEAQDVNWNRVMFTDETDLQKHDVGSNPGNVIRKKEEVGNPELMKDKNTTNYARIHVWAAIGYDYKSPLFLMPLRGGHSEGKKWIKAEALNGEIYGKFVYSTLGPCFNDFKTKHSRRDTVMCLEDNHGPHNGPQSIAAHQALQIPRFNHPPNSPDLNPIEVCWHILKARMRSWEGMISNFDDLFAIAQQVWEGITLEDVNRQVNKLAVRYKLVKKEQGGRICDWHHTPKK